MKVYLNHKVIQEKERMGPMKKFLIGAVAVAIIAVGFCGAAIRDKIPRA